MFAIFNILQWIDDHIGVYFSSDCRFRVHSRSFYFGSKSCRVIYDYMEFCWVWNAFFECSKRQRSAKRLHNRTDIHSILPFLIALMSKYQMNKKNERARAIERERKCRGDEVINFKKLIESIMAMASTSNKNGTAIHVIEKINSKKFQINNRIVKLTQFWSIQLFSLFRLLRLIRMFSSPAVRQIDDVLPEIGIDVKWRNVRNGASIIFNCRNAKSSLSAPTSIVACGTKEALQCRDSKTKLFISHSRFAEQKFLVIRFIQLLLFFLDIKASEKSQRKKNFRLKFVVSCGLSEQPFVCFLSFAFCHFMTASMSSSCASSSVTNFYDFVSP